MIRQCGVVNNEVIVTNKGKGRSFLLCSWLSTVSQKKLIHNKLILTSGTTVAARSSWSPRPSEALIFHHQYYDFFSLAVFLIGATTLNNTGQNMNFFIHFVYNGASLNGPPSQPSFIPSFIHSFIFLGDFVPSGRDRKPTTTRVACLFSSRKKNPTFLIIILGGGGVERLPSQWPHFKAVFW